MTTANHPPTRQRDSINVRLMSNIPSEPSHGSPSTSPQQDPTSRDHSLSKAPLLKIQTVPTSSSSLLTQGLAASSNHQQDTSVDAIVNNNTANTPELLARDLPEQLQQTPPLTSGNVIAQDTEEASHNMTTTVSTRFTPTFLSESGLSRSAPHQPAGNADQADYRRTGSRPLAKMKMRGRGTSLERTQKEKRVQEQPKGFRSTNPGDTALPPLPSSPNPSALSTISNNPPIDGVRARYRSWRDASPVLGQEKAWSFGKGNPHEDQEGKVEKSIAEALAGIEPSNRSRKASHSLGWFREGLPEEKSKRREKSRAKSSEKATQRTDSQTSGDEHDTAIHEQEQLRARSKDAGADLSTSTQFKSTMSGADDSTHYSIRGTAGRSPALQSTVNSDGAEGYFNQPRKIEEQRKLSALPAQLLAEIRNVNYNLTPGAQPGSSFSKSIPTTISEKMQSLESGSADELQKNAPEDYEATPSSPIKSQDEDEESGEEQISSALFVPHKTAESPDTRDNSQSPDRQDRRDSNADGPEQWLVEHEVPTGESEQQYFSPSKGDAAREKAESKALQDADAAVDKLKNRHQISEPDAGFYSDIGYSTREDESSLTDDPELTPTGKKPGQYMERHHNQRRRDLQQTSKAPLEAIELIPYRHQVGGHTTMWRFSKRAVCKQLNNRENEFYEKVEHYHPKLLKFLPRYIGVLNVTFEKHQRRKSAKKDSGAAVDRENDIPSQNAVEVSSPEKGKSTATDDPSNQPRMISHTLQTNKAPIPTVTFADNRHIIPSSFLQPDAFASPYTSPQRPFQSSKASSEKQSGPRPPEGDFTFRPTLSEKHAASWGATTVNKQLRNEVFGEAFLQQPIPIHCHKKPASSHRSLPLRKTANHLRASNSESSLIYAQQTQPASVGGQKPEVAEVSMRRKAMKAAAERSSAADPSVTKSSEVSQGIACSTVQEAAPPASAEQTKQFGEKAGTSAPEPEFENDLTNNKKKRRYSGGGLRRKAEEADADSRGTLKYYVEADDAGYRGDVDDDVFKIDPELSRTTDVPPSQAPDPKTPANASSNVDGLFKSVDDSRIRGTPGAMLPAAPNDSVKNFSSPLPRPVNPKEAQTQPDSRVEYFLLLEDLTAGMKRPCIMDLKMGTRQYGVEANEKKQKSQRQKCGTTTSQELGVRVCGLQVWDVKTQSYIFQDKYFGRNLKAGSEFQEALMRFLYDGVDYNSILRHIPTLLAKLQQLEAIIRTLHGYRFYAASLLLFYDGDDSPEDDADDTENSMNGKKTRNSRHKEIDFKIADFANCVTAQDVLNHPRICPPQHPADPDRGFLRGLRSLRTYFLRIQQKIEMKVLEADSSSGSIDFGDTVTGRKGKEVELGEGLSKLDLDDDEGEISL